MTLDSPTITIFGTNWCGGSRSVRRLLDQHAIPYRWVDIDEDPESARYVESVARGFRSVPTLLFPDGTVMVEPPMSALAKKLGIPYP